MKTMKKLFAAVLALMLVLSLAVPAMAADPTYELTINQSNTKHTYEVFQVFTGDLLDGTNDNNDETTGVILSNIKWGEDIVDGKALVAALKADDKALTYKSGGTTHTTTLASVFSSVDENDALAAQKVADILGQNLPSVVVDRFAEIVGSVDGAYKHNHVKDPDIVTYDATKNGYKVDLPAGYYLVKDQEKSQNETSSFYTAYILQVVHAVTVTPKGSTVTLDKLINDTIDGTFTNVEDFDINDDVFYKLEGTLPTNLDAYETYYYKFEDELPVGITFEHVGQIYIENADGQRVHTILDVHDELETNNDAPTNVTIQYEEATRILTIEFTNLKELYNGLAAGNKVIVKYECYVNRNAKCDSKPNTNKATLYYENNPDGEGVGKTESNFAHAYTYQMKIQKYIQNTTTPLENVEFLLYFTRNETVGEQVVTKTYYAKVITEEDVEKGTIINEKVVTEDDVGVVYGWTLNRDADHIVDSDPKAGIASVLDTNNLGQIHLRGLDADTYYLEETKTNQGYNLLTDAIPVVIKPEYQNPSDDVSTSKVEYYVKGVNQNDNWVVIVENAKGSTLPTTGGMGTTIFYVLGGVLVAAALVVLVTKKRMSA